MLSLSVAQPLWVNDVVNSLKEGYKDNDSVYLALMLRVSLFQHFSSHSLTFSKLLLRCVVGSSVAAVSRVQAPPLPRPLDQTPHCLSH